MNLKLAATLAFAGCVVALLAEFGALVVYLKETPSARPMVFLGSLAFMIFYGGLATYFMALSHLSRLVFKDTADDGRNAPSGRSKAPSARAAHDEYDEATVVASERVCPNCEKQNNNFDGRCRYCGFDFTRPRVTGTPRGTSRR